MPLRVLIHYTHDIIIITHYKQTIAIQVFENARTRVNLNAPSMPILGCTSKSVDATVESVPLAG